MSYLEFGFTDCLLFGAIISATDPGEAQQKTQAGFTFCIAQAMARVTSESADRLPTAASMQTIFCCGFGREVQE